jgi:hypothetical protein
MVYDLRSRKWSDLCVHFYAGGTWWSRDSQSINFVGYHNGQSRAVFRLRLSDHRLEQVVSLAHFRQATNGAGDWMGIGPGNSFLLLEDTGSEDIYALDVKLP